MRVLSWNCRRAKAHSALWQYFQELSPDIAVLQEVGVLPDEIKELYSVLVGTPRTKNGENQNFQSALLVRGSILSTIPLKSDHAWVNDQLDHFQGNILSFSIRLTQGQEINVIGVYSPAWPIPQSCYVDKDISEVKLSQNPSVWVADLITSALRNAPLNGCIPWIVAGDFNSCETFDKWKGGPRGNREWLDRMASLDLKECLSHSQGRLVPTFKGPRMQAASCQIDKLFVTPALSHRLRECFVGDELRIFGNGLSDHLPVVADFDN